MDALSLDSNRPLQKKLISISFTYHNTFQHSLLFQKSLNCIVEIYGLFLYIIIHMLQSICVIYKEIMTWAQCVIEWTSILAVGCL